MMYFGDIQRSSRVHHSRISSVTCSTSLPNPWKSFALPPWTARVWPVDIGSMNTRSEAASRLSGLSTSRYGGGCGAVTSPRSTRRGPSRPMCSQIDEEPGPPLNTNVIGRVVTSPSSRVYAVTDISARAFQPLKTSSSTSSSRSTTRPVRAV